MITIIVKIFQRISINLTGLRGIAVSFDPVFGTAARVTGNNFYFDVTYGTVILNGYQDMYAFWRPRFQWEL